MISHPKNWSYWTKQGLFTLAMGADNRLMAAEVNAKQASVVRALGGFIFDREGFAKDAAEVWSEKISVGSFTPVGKHRVFLLKGG